MQKIHFILILFYCSFFNQNFYATSLVYNMKIRRLFSLNASVFTKKKSNIVASVVPIIYKRKRHIIQEDLNINSCEKSLIGGSILNIRYVSGKLWWLEATTGIEKESVRYKGTLNFHNSRTGLDDIILSGGYNIAPNDRSQISFYGLAGFPTRTKITALERENTLVGTRFFSLGLGTEFSYSFINKLKQSLIAIAQLRFIHFFDRSWFPVLPKDAKIRPGNTTDILLTLQYRKRKNIIETGYNPTFFTNQAVLLKQQTIKTQGIVRESFYLTFSHLFKEFPVLKIPGLIGGGISTAHSNRFNTRISAYWLNFSVLF